MKVPRSSSQNNLETITNELYKETPKERYISPEERQKTITDLRLIKQYNKVKSKSNKFLR